MKKQLWFSLLVFALGFITSCGPQPKDAFKKGKGPTDPTVSSEDEARGSQTRLLLEQISAVKQSIEITKAQTALASKCRSLTPLPGENPFLRIEYFSCPITLSGFGAKAIHGTFTGIEEYSIKENKIVASAPELQLFADGKLYQWSRELTINAKLDDILSAAGVSFHLKESILPNHDAKTSNEWMINIFGTAKLVANGAGQNFTVQNFTDTLDATVIYTRPKWVPAKKQYEPVQARLKMRAQQDVMFSGSCSRPLARFVWEASEGSKAQGVVQASANNVVDPDGNDPVFHKPEPLPKCE